MGSQTMQIIVFALLLGSPWCIESKISNADLYKKPKNFHKVSALNKTSFTDEEKKLILDIHNAYRSNVQPPALGMRELIWDDDLEAFAKKESAKCTGAHSHRRMVKVWNWRYTDNWITGENLYYSYADKYSIEQALYLWWEEGENYTIHNHSCNYGVCGHYIQMVWAKASRIGCAVQYCETFSVSKYPTPATLIACNYDEQLLTRQKPYTVGEACKDCTRAKLGYSYQYCRHRLCIGPYLKFREAGYDGDASVAFGSLIKEDP